MGVRSRNVIGNETTIPTFGTMTRDSIHSSDRWISYQDPKTLQRCESTGIVLTNTAQIRAPVI
jgi:hypothetical protein